MVTTMDKEQILHLAKLARLELHEKEIETFPGQLADVLNFVKQVQDVDVSDVQARDFSLVNVMREDENPFESGENTEAILQEMPATKDNYLQTKKIL